MSLPDALTGTLEQRWIGDPAGLLNSWRSGASRLELLLVSPFGEDQSRCRRLQHDIAACLVADGCAVHWLDLPGTGDSPMPESDIRRPIWLASIDAAVQAIGLLGQNRLWIGGLRLGATVAAHWAAERGWPHALLLLDPLDGSTALRTLLRAAVVRYGRTLSDLRAQLEAGETVEAAGFPISGGCAATMDAFVWPCATLQQPHQIKHPAELTPPWMQVEPRADPALARHLANGITAATVAAAS